MDLAESLWHKLEWLFLATIFVVSTLLTLIVRQYALRRRLLDIPNARSSHSQPVPRGGGIAIVVSFLGGCIYLHTRQQLPFSLLITLVGGGGLLALIGFWEDHRPLPIKIRLAAHFAAAAWALYWLPGETALGLDSLAWPLAALGYLCASIGIVWLINLYNFMDGIDGLAVSQTLFVSSALVLLLQQTDAYPLLLTSAVMGASCLGFLLFNWSPASIFMGDSGSCFLGFALASLALISIGTNALSLWSWAILLGVFWVDASVTLLRRMLTGQRWHTAHRSHAYQHTAHWLGSHSRTTTMIAVLNSSWLLACAWLSLDWPRWAPLTAVLALLPLAILALALEAGREDRITN